MPSPNMAFDRERFEAFLYQVDTELVPVLGSAATRLQGNQKLAQNYSAACDSWRAGKVDHVRGLTETVNEMCIARLMVEDKTVSHVSYEPTLEGSQKTIDFVVMYGEDDTRVCLDVKTVQPTEKDCWVKYEEFQEKELFTSGTRLVLDKDGMGGQIAHERFASRARFLEYALELEGKIRAVNRAVYPCFHLVLCGNGVQWRRDHIEDFADFYFSGHPRADDPLGKMQAHHMKAQGIVFDRSIRGFCFLKRNPIALKPEAFICDIRGPMFPWDKPSKSQ